ncbi:MAG: hypothetical protein BM556_17900 [Bacteriovorax sp. MedPE-SWde]|nr:MAG: hypothetical protein BM556_17900 [Bacteriovorax sp. MedPE-SWde]
MPKIVKSSDGLFHKVNKLTTPKEYFLFEDHDFDGIPDKLDHDIDGDGVHNLLDHSPLNEQEKGVDKDNDGIMDHIDFDYTKYVDNRPLADLQELIKKDYGITIVSTIKLTNELKLFIDSVLSKNLVSNHKALEVIVIKDRNYDNPNYRGIYDKYWKQITLYKRNLSTNTNFQLVLSHEYFHFIQNQNKSFYDLFLKETGWLINNESISYQHNANTSYPIHKIDEHSQRYDTENTLTQYDNFPSLYSTVSPQEMFSEVGAALINESMTHIDFRKRYPHFNAFKVSHAYKIMSNFTD